MIMLKQLNPKVVLLTIKNRYAYYDTKSIEEFTGIKKEKYKIAKDPNIDLDSFIFFVLTTDKDTISESCRVCISRSDWEGNILNGHLLGEYSYSSATDIDIIVSQNLIDKINDSHNRFINVAVLCKNKYNELVNSCVKIINVESLKLNKEKKNAISIMRDQVIKKLDLKY